MLALSRGSMRTDDETTMRELRYVEIPEASGSLCHQGRSRSVTYADARTDRAIGEAPLADCWPSMAKPQVHHLSSYETRNDKCCCRREPANHRRLGGATNGLGAGEAPLNIAKDDQGDQRD